jgi:hypothetical protein
MTRPASSKRRWKPFTSSACGLMARTAVIRHATGSNLGDCKRVVRCSGAQKEVRFQVNSSGIETTAIGRDRRIVGLS